MNCVLGLSATRIHNTRSAQTNVCCKRQTALPMPIRLFRHAILMRSPIGPCNRYCRGMTLLLAMIMTRGWFIGHTVARELALAACYHLKTRRTL
jgi:hypothetical protein